DGTGGCEFVSTSIRPRFRNRKRHRTAALQNLAEARPAHGKIVVAGFVAAGRTLSYFSGGSELAAISRPARGWHFHRDQLAAALERAAGRRHPMEGRHPWP